MEDRLWSELTDTKLYIEFLSLYIDRQRRWLRYFNISILVFSTGGILGWKIWDGIPGVVCVIVAAISLLRLIQPHLIMDDKQISALDQMYSISHDHFTQLERLWYEYSNKKKTEDEIAKEFFDLCSSKEIKEFNQLSFSAIRKKPKALVREADRVTNEYFNRVYNQS